MMHATKQHGRPKAILRRWRKQGFVPGLPPYTSPRVAAIDLGCVSRARCGRCHHRGRASIPGSAFHDRARDAALRGIEAQLKERVETINR